MYIQHFKTFGGRLVGLCLVCMIFGCSGSAPEQVNVIPAPAEVKLSKGAFSLSDAGVVYSKGFSEAEISAVGRFSDKLSIVSGKEIIPALSEETKGNVSFVFDESIAEEAYELEVRPDAVLVRTSSIGGLVYAMGTIAQMAGEPFFGDSVASLELPCCRISDAPRFSYRGMHLDVARHFFEVDAVKKYLDLMALYKMNRFHWHLSDDQGWRVEIKKYPRLTSVGAYRAETMVGRIDYDEEPLRYDGKPYGDFYTQDEIREVVDYAASLGITVIPEIDLPGHMLSALAAYPHLGCTGGPYKVWGRWGISKDVLCIGKDSTFDFIEGVIDEICGLFPGESLVYPDKENPEAYIHIGGDECPKIAWRKCAKCQARIEDLGIKWDGQHLPEQFLQNYVTARVQAYLNGKGRNIIGWDEILEGELQPGATIMSWRGVDGGIEGASKGFDVIMTPYTYLYLDYYQSDKVDSEPLGIGGHLPIEKVYSFEPYDGLDAQAQQHIVGVQANLWTEYIESQEHLEYNLLPRMLAVSEVQWCAPERRDFDRFKKVLVEHELPIFEALGCNYSKAVLGIYGMQ